MIDTVETVPVGAVVPEDINLVLRSRGLSRRLLAEETQRLLAIHLFQTRVLSLGQAARLAGLSKWDFIDLLGSRNIPVIDYPDDELEAEQSALAALKEGLVK